MNAEIERAKTLLAEEMAEEFLALALRLQADGTATWTLDPQVTGVVGLVMVGTLDALVVVYADGSWETSERFERLAWTVA